MPKGARVVIAGLERKGFQRRENDHTFLQLWMAGRKTAIYTKVSHGEKEIGDKLLGAMARQICLTRRQLLELVDCSMSAEDYIHVLRADGHIA